MQRIMLKHRKIISASRRCDLVAFYPEYFIDALNRFPVDEIHSIVLWTKDPTNILANDSLRRKLLSFSNTYLLLSITGLGATLVEPLVPEPKRVFQMIRPLEDFLGGPEHIALRFDPLIHIVKPESDEDVSNIRRNMALWIMDEMARFRIRRLIISVAEIYSKSAARMRKMGLAVAPQFQLEAEHLITETLIPEALQKDIVLECCASPNLTSRGCINSAILQDIHPRHYPASTAKDSAQREYCNCSTSIDIGKWFSCPHGCAYCYGNPLSNASGPDMNGG